MAATYDNHPNGRLLSGRYRLLERVGMGGMATVHRAHDERLKRQVAVKLIAECLSRDPLYVRHFRLEAKLGAELAHPNIVAVLDAGAEPRDFLVMELVEGVDARSLLRASARATADQALDVVEQVCDALAHAHDRGVVHCDVSPGNILIREVDGTAKLADFGAASHATEPPPNAAKGIIGTPGYIAPEVLRGARPSPRSDLFSLGRVAYRLLGGPRSPGATGPRATAPQATAIPAAVRRALAHDPSARQRSIAEFRDELLGADAASLELARAA
jgi:serine/threonine-protein kinase